MYDGGFIMKCIIPYQRCIIQFECYIKIPNILGKPNPLKIFENRKYEIYTFTLVEFQNKELKEEKFIHKNYVGFIFL